MSAEPEGATEPKSSHHDEPDDGVSAGVLAQQRGDGKGTANVGACCKVYGIGTSEIADPDDPELDSSPATENCGLGDCDRGESNGRCVCWSMSWVFF